MGAIDESLADVLRRVTKHALYFLLQPRGMHNWHPARTALLHLRHANANPRQGIRAARHHADCNHLKPA
jgi:hypothetical protein